MSAPAAAADQPITFQSMADRLTAGLVASLIGAVLVFVSAFLTWATVHARTVAGGRVLGAVAHTSGLSGGRLGTETLLLSILSVVIVAVMLLPATKAWAWQVLLAFGLVIALFALIDLVSIPGSLKPDGFSCPSGVTCSFHRSAGAGVWFTFVAGLIVAAGAYVHHRKPVLVRPGGRPQASESPNSDTSSASTSAAAVASTEPDEPAEPGGRGAPA